MASKNASSAGNQQERLEVNKYTIIGLLTATILYFVLSLLGRNYIPDFKDNFLYGAGIVIVSLVVFRFISNKFHF